MSTAFDRRSAIISILGEHGRASTRSLSARLGVSEVTIRNDLGVLEQQGWAQRVHGGAEAGGRPFAERSFADRRHIHTHEKQRLAAAAAALVQPGETLLIDSSTSAYQLARHLAGRGPLRVVTNSYHAAGALASAPGIEVILLGGVLRPDTSSLVGPFVPLLLERLHADRAFVSAAGLSVARGLTDADIREVEVKQAMVAAAGSVVALIDASKFGRDSFLSFAAVADLDVLLSDQPLPPDLAAHCRAAGVESIVVHS